MSETLPFTQHVLSMGRNLQALGQDGAAARLLSRLSSFRDLPSDLAGETHLRLAEMLVDQRRYKQARRQLTAVLALQPDNAQAHYLMAEAALEDEARDPRRAMLHYRHCTRLEPKNAHYWCALGELALYQGDTAGGLDALRRAERLAPDDVDILNQVVKSLRCEGKVAEAKQILRAALFRHPRDKRFANLWSEHQFEVLHEAQADLKQRWKLAQKNSPVLLPFVRPHQCENPPRADAKRIRLDPPSGTPGPKGPLRRESRKKKA
jgi:tetratricopeptide (TPR) repeat protein